MYSSPPVDVKQVEIMMHKEDAETPLLKFEIKNRLGLLTLDNTSRRNAITSGMRQKLMATYKECVQNPDIYAIVTQSADQDFFSAGTDLREVQLSYAQSEGEAKELFKEEYEAIWGIECYTKIIIPMINGPVMGGGIGITQHVTHVVAGENYTWSMPEVKIGFFPDVGITHLLARMPGSIGTYLGLTGRAINRHDARYLGLLEFCIDTKEWPGIIGALQEAEPVDPMLDKLNLPIEASDIEKLEPVIASVFGEATVEAIIEALKSIDPAHKSWADDVLEDLAAASPTSLKVTLQAIHRAKTLGLDETLQQDYQLVKAFLQGHDFMAAITARLIDKTNPVWKPSELTDISKAQINAYFDITPSDNLELPSRELGLNK